jgi:hypothetical protein
MTRTKLYRAAGVAAVVAGLIFVLLQFIHPDETVENVATSTWKAVHVLTMVMTALALVGVLGIYLRQVNESGVLGLIGVVLYGCGFFIIYGFSFVEAAVLPQLADTDPSYVADVIELTATGQASGELGGLAAANVASGVTYILGGVLFGVALWRARVLWRWAAALLVIGALSTSLIQVLPESLDRLVAIPVGVAWAGLGISLWQSTATRGGFGRDEGRDRLDATAV